MPTETPAPTAALSSSSIQFVAGDVLAGAAWVVMLGRWGGGSCRFCATCRRFWTSMALVARSIAWSIFSISSVSVRSVVSSLSRRSSVSASEVRPELPLRLGGGVSVAAPSTRRSVFSAWALAGAGALRAWGGSLGAGALAGGIWSASASAVARSVFSWRTGRGRWRAGIWTGVPSASGMSASSAGLARFRAASRRCCSAGVVACASAMSSRVCPSLADNWETRPVFLGDGAGTESVKGLVLCASSTGASGISTYWRSRS